MERSARLGMQRRRMLCALLVSGLVGGGCTPGNSNSRLGVPPTPFAGFLRCPAQYEFGAYGSVVYPPTHPQHPAVSDPPGRCFASVEQANLAGYNVAPTPGGDVVVDGVYLVPRGPEVTVACQDAAARLNFQPPCPTLVPFGWSGALAPLSLGVFVLDGGFAPTPPGYVGAPADMGPDVGHLNIWAVPQRKFGPQGFDYCFPSTVIRHTQIHGNPAQVLRCASGSGLDSGHLTLQWHSTGVVYGVSLHGYSKVNEQLDIAIASHLGG
jgi:hypothetical protein